MKIVGIDNFDREIYDDILVAENVNESYAKRIAEFLNSSKRDPEIFYDTKEDNYKLYKFEP